MSFTRPQNGSKMCPKMVPKWFQKWSQNGPNIDPKKGTQKDTQKGGFGVGVSGRGKLPVGRGTSTLLMVEGLQKSLC